jgi:hypothetical protein
MVVCVVVSEMALLKSRADGRRRDIIQQQRKIINALGEKPV